MTPTIKITQAGTSDIDAVAPLFDQYRQFYGLPSDPVLARRFIAERIGNAEAVVFVAISAQELPVGFTLLYPTFSSLTAARIFILYDLFVAPTARKSGVGSALLQAAEQHARSAGAASLALSTATTNLAAQRLYERHGWVRDTVFLTYERLLV